MLKKQEISYNPYFFFPFLVWVVIGGVLLASFTRSELFHAVNTHYSDAGNAIMFYTTWLGQGELITPVLLLLMLIPRFRNWWFFSTAALCNLIPFALQQGLKSLFDTPRPRLLYYDRLWVHTLPDWPVLLHRGFPSGHSEGAFSFFCFLSLLLPKKYNKLGFVFFTLAMGVLYSRMYLAAHFFEDIYAGSIIGALSTTIIYSVMDNYKSNNFFTKKTLI